MLRRNLLPTILVWLTLALASCHGHKPDEAPTPDRTDDGVYKLAEHVSEQADAVVVIRNIEQFMGHLERQRAFELIDVDAPPEAVGRILAGSMGFDPRDVRAWRSKGIRTDAPLMIAFSGDDPVLVVPIADAELFDAYMNEQPWAFEDPRPGRYRHFGARRAQSQSEPELPEEGPRLWHVEDGVACISLHGRRRYLEQTCVTPGLLSGPSMSEFESFLAFRDGPMRGADIGFFAPSYNSVTVEEFVDAFSREDILALEVVMRSIAETMGFSMTGTVDGDALEGRARLELTDAGHAAFSELFDVSSVVDTRGVTPPNAVAALRLAVSPAEAWSWVRTVLHWEARQGIRQKLAELEELLGREVDIESEFVDHLAGEMVMVVEPIPKTATSSGKQGRGRPRYRRYALTEDGMAFSFIVAFEDPVAAPKLVELLEDIDTAENSKQGRPTRVLVREGAKGTGITIAELKNQYAPRMYVRGKLLVIAPSVLPVEHVQKMLMGEHPGPDSEGSRRFNDATGVASGFFDFQAFFDAVGRARAKDELGDLVRQMQFAEASMRLEPGALVADGRMVDLSFVRIIASGMLGSEVRRWSSTPHRRLRELARTAARYYARYQRGCSDVSSCEEPWHADVKGRVASGERVFPGGTNQRLVSHSTAPVGGRQVEGDIDARRFAEATASLLGLHDRVSGRFQYIYETNGKTGPGARFTVKAIADLDPTTPQKHTFVLTGEAGSSGRVDISEVEERHRFQ